MQTSGYTSNQALGVEGQIADTMPAEVISLINGESTAVTYGTGVVDAGDGTFEEIDSMVDDLGGINILEHAEDNADEDAASTPTERMGSILRRGRVIVEVETAVSVGDDAFVRFDDGVADATQTTKGKWGNDSDTNTRRHVRNAKFITAAAKGALAILEVDFTKEAFDLVTKMEDIGALSSTTTVELGAGPVDRPARLNSAQLSAGQAAGDATDHWIVQIKSGTTVLASWDSDVSEDGAITQNTYQELNAVAAAYCKPGERLTAVFTKYNSGAAWTAGKINLDLEVL